MAGPPVEDARLAINGCAYCLDMHSKDARALGEIEQRLYVLDVWEEDGLATGVASFPRTNEGCTMG